MMQSVGRPAANETMTGPVLSGDKSTVNVLSVSILPIKWTG